MSGYGFLAVGVGGALGCWTRWLLGIGLNPLFANMLLGTLVANLTGGFLIGCAVEYFVHHDSLPPELRDVFDAWATERGYDPTNPDSGEDQAPSSSPVLRRFKR